MKPEKLYDLSRGEEREEIKEGLDEWFDPNGERERKAELLSDVLVDMPALNKQLAAAGVSPETVYDWYKDAMVRRDRAALGKEAFISHYFNMGSRSPGVAFGDPERGYALGFMYNGVFVPSHFAPKSIRKGYELFSDLGESKDVPVVLLVTPDLVETLRKMPFWHELDAPITSVFRDMLHEKRLVYNEHPEVIERMKVIFEDMMSKSRAHKSGDYNSEAA